MTSSASGASTTPRAEVGDLIKATRKADPESTITGRVQTVTPRGGVLLRFHGSMWPEDWDIEVLEQAEPPIDKELLEGAIDTYVTEVSKIRPEAQAMTRNYYEAGLTAVINFINQHHNKEN